MNKLKGLAAGTAAGIVFGLAINYAFNTPEVQISHSTGQCVKVINFREKDTYTCDNLPSKYNHVWVK